MLIEFTVGNFLSFKDKVTFSMKAAKSDELIENTFETPEVKHRLLKTAGIFGPNASGKSNFLLALNSMKMIVLGSLVQPLNSYLPIKPFLLSTDTREKPTYFEIKFVSFGKKYRYGFELTSKKIIKEWLFHIPSQRESKLFERDSPKMNPKNLFAIYKNRKMVVENTREDRLFLSTDAQLNGKESIKVIDWFINLSVLFDQKTRTEHFSTFKLIEQGNKDMILNLLNIGDLNIKDVSIEDISEQFNKTVTDQEKLNGRLMSVSFTHNIYNNNSIVAGKELFTIDQESKGTVKLFEISGEILETLINGNVMIIDEFDSSFHPFITRMIQKLFIEHNPKNAQLIFCSHNPLEMLHLRKDQIWLMDKDETGASDLYSLAEFKRLRTELYLKQYMLGTFGAVPEIGDLDKLAEVFVDAEKEEK